MAYFCFLLLYTFILNGFLFYYLLLKSEVVPKFISVWGAVGILALLISTVLKLDHIPFEAINYFLILVITNEVFLAFWLLLKGIIKQGDSDLVMIKQ